MQILFLIAEALYG